MLLLATDGALLLFIWFFFPEHPVVTIVSRLPSRLPLPSALPFPVDSIDRLTVSLSLSLQPSRVRHLSQSPACHSLPPCTFSVSVSIYACPSGSQRHFSSKRYHQ